MKKLMICAVTACMLFCFIPSQAIETVKGGPTPTLAITSTIPTEAALSARLNEIKAMDKSSLNRTEKKELKSEIKAIESAQDGVYVGHSHSHGIYYGLGAVLLVVLIVLLVV